MANEVAKNENKDQEEMHTVFNPRASVEYAWATGYHFLTEWEIAMLEIDQVDFQNGMAKNNA